MLGLYGIANLFEEFFPLWGGCFLRGGSGLCHFVAFLCWDDL